MKIEEVPRHIEGLVFDDQLDLGFDAIDHIQGVSVFEPHPIVYINREDFRPHCRLMEWGCIEFYAKAEPDWKKRNGMLNIRSERILDDPKSYWHKIRNRRCLIPVSGIFEHREVKGWKKKVPYLVRPAGQSVFFLPGLYSVAELPDRETGEMIRHWTFGLITRAANALMKNIHNGGDNRGRMPLFLPQQMAKAFLSEELTAGDYKDILSFEMPSENLDHHTVNTLRTPKARPDGKAKHEAFEWAKLPPLGEANPD